MEALFVTSYGLICHPVSICGHTTSCLRC